MSRRDVVPTAVHGPRGGPKGMWTMRGKKDLSQALSKKDEKKRKKRCTHRQYNKITIITLLNIIITQSWPCAGIKKVRMDDEDTTKRKQTK